MKFRVEVDGEPLLLELEPHGDGTAYTLHGEADRGGVASIEEVMPGVFSVLLKNRSLQVHVSPHPDGLEVWVGLQRHLISLVDSRDRTAREQHGGAEGPFELRAQMAGKIIRLMEDSGASVSVGQGLIVVEAMKMQNEMKSPKSGTLTSIHVVEGATVSAGDLLLVVE